MCRFCKMEKHPIYEDVLSAKEHLYTGWEGSSEVVIFYSKSEHKFYLRIFVSKYSEADFNEDIEITHCMKCGRKLVVSEQMDI